MLGFFIGAASGAVQFLLLSKFTAAITGGSVDNKAVILAVSQLFLPLIVLLGCALLHLGSLLWAGVGMAASLVICAAARFLFSLKKVR